MIKEALFYVKKLNFSIIPIEIIPKIVNGIEKKIKKPLTSWKKFQTRKPTPQEITMWWKMWPDAKLGIVTGAVSNLAVIDIDTLEGYEAIDRYVKQSDPPKVNTPSGGQHLYFRYPKEGIRNNSRAVVGCDLRGEGGYVVAPPSLDYEWLDKTKLHNFPPLPNIYLREIGKEKSIDKRFVRELFKKGARNDDLFHTANCLVKGGMHFNGVLQIITMLAGSIQPPTKHNDPITIINIVTSAWSRRRK